MTRKENLLIEIYNLRNQIAEIKGNKIVNIDEFSQTRKLICKNLQYIKHFIFNVLYTFIYGIIIWCNSRKHLYNLPLSARIAIFAQKIGLKLADSRSL